MEAAVATTALAGRYAFFCSILYIYSTNYYLPIEHAYNSMKRAQTICLNRHLGPLYIYFFMFLLCH